MKDSQKRLADARAAYDKLCVEAAASVKADKAFEKEIAEEIKKKKKNRVKGREELVKQKGDAYKELVKAREDRRVELLAEVASGETTQSEAAAELVSLGHTAASADIEIRRATGKANLTTAPEPQQSAPAAPVPERDVPKPQEQTPKIKVDDPVSAAKSESETVKYIDGTQQVKTEKVAAPDLSTQKK